MSAPGERPSDTSAPEGWLRGYLSPEGNELLDRALAEYAHELAEKIRRVDAPSDADQRFVVYVNGWCDGRSEAADLIDPKVS